MNNNQLVEDVRNAISDLLDERNRVDAETHQKHHRFVELQIEHYERRKALCQKLTDFLSQWALGALVVWAIWKATGVKVQPPW